MSDCEAPSPAALDRYADTINEALGRLAGYGPQWGQGLAFHAPMAAEALTRLGLYDDVAGWIERNRTVTRAASYTAQPDQYRPIPADDPDEQRAALGQMRRFTDWAMLFRAELASQPWREVLTRWWPTLIPGLAGGLGHGMIRTAHAVRGVSSVPEPTSIQLNELAQGLAFWASSYWSPPPATGSPLLAGSDPAPDQARSALVTATTKAAALVGTVPVLTIPLVHAVTIPAAVELMLPLLPLSEHPAAYEYAVRAATNVLSLGPRQAGRTPPTPAARGDAVPPLRECVAAAVQTEDEHAIKLVEVCVRSSAAHPEDDAYRRAVIKLVDDLKRGLAVP